MSASRICRPLDSQALVALIERFHLQGNIRLEVRSIVDVQIRAHQRIPRIDEAQHGAHSGVSAFV